MTSAGTGTGNGDDGRQPPDDVDTDEGIERLADEAEGGFDLSNVRRIHPQQTPASRPPRKIRRWPVTSRALRSVGYDPQTWTLEVEFVSGEVYRYFDVDPLDVEAMMQADSMGAYLNEEIKPNYEAMHVES